MVTVTLKHLTEAAAKFRDAAGELSAWHKIVATARWRSFAEVRAAFPDVSYVDRYVIFNIRHNRYRLVTVIHYAKDLPAGSTQGHVYIRAVLTHKEYDNQANWDPYKNN